MPTLPIADIGHSGEWRFYPAEGTRRRLVRVSRSYVPRRHGVLYFPINSRLLLAHENTCRLRARARIELVTNFPHNASHAARCQAEQRPDVLVAQSCDQPL